VGLAYRIPSLAVVAFESTSEGQQLLRKLATLNNVQDRIQIHGFCDQASLAKCLQEAPRNTILICDVEGAEEKLLDPQMIPQLTSVSILVELHPWEAPDIRRILTQRFQTTSLVTAISSVERSASDFPPQLRVNLSDSVKVDAMNELRPPQMEWLWIEPKGLS
jgi:hypothetical protein